eukprot:TRINITY_DN27635_c0_g1_i1.p1 TRINITY_DN27635_c0_g1~~TRINITY_DN27635_c0_g1_i1.p1  ORF type:complete len:297 (+),score=61.85 TRINITY_DN27635_c0_g1_i1:66-956(+)
MPKAGTRPQGHTQKQEQDVKVPWGAELERKFQELESKVSEKLDSFRLELVPLRQQSQRCEDDAPPAMGNGEQSLRVKAPDDDRLARVEVQLAQLAGSVKAASEESTLQAQQLKALEGRLTEQLRVKEEKLRAEMLELEEQLLQRISSSVLASESEQVQRMQRLEDFVSERLTTSRSGGGFSDRAVEAEALLLDLLERMSLVEHHISEERDLRQHSGSLSQVTRDLSALQEAMQQKLPEAMLKLQRIQEEAFGTQSKIEQQGVRLKSCQARIDQLEEQQQTILFKGSFPDSPRMHSR